jgi:hypothetical protein
VRNTILKNLLKGLDFFFLDVLAVVPRFILQIKELIFLITNLYHDIGLKFNYKNAFGLIQKINSSLKQMLPIKFVKVEL